MLSQILLEHEVLKSYPGIMVHRLNLNEEKNKYWYVKNINNNETYYIMDCNNQIVKIDENSINTRNYFRIFRNGAINENLA